MDLPVSLCAWPAFVGGFCDEAIAFLQVATPAKFNLCIDKGAYGQVFEKLQFAASGQVDVEDNAVKLKIFYLPDTFLIRNGGFA